MDLRLALLSGIDIPFPEAKTVLHQPTIKEISYLGEEKFFLGCELISFSKKNLSLEEQEQLKDYSNFEIFYSLFTDYNNPELLAQRFTIEEFLELLFPQSFINFEKGKIIISDLSEEGLEKNLIEINGDNFNKLQKLIKQIFCLTSSAGEDFNAQGELAKKIADKLKKGRRQIAKSNKQQKKRESVFDRYISILAVGEQKDINELMNYTVYQLFDEFERFEKKISFDSYTQALMAGAQNLDKVENWMIDIHSQDKK